MIEIKISLIRYWSNRLVGKTLACLTDEDFITASWKFLRLYLGMTFELRDRHLALWAIAIRQNIALINHNK